jgi:hypothetical protein
MSTMRVWQILAALIVGVPSPAAFGQTVAKWGEMNGDYQYAYLRGVVDTLLEHGLSDSDKALGLDLSAALHCADKKKWRLPQIVGQFQADVRSHPTDYDGVAVSTAVIMFLMKSCDK